jgi:HK97 family phage major capsid protein
MRLFLTRLRLALVALFVWRSPQWSLKAFSYVPIAGADGVTDVTNAREEYNRAKRKLHAAADEVDLAADRNDAKGLDEASGRMKAAKADADAKLEAYELAKATHEARLISLPDTAGDGGAPTQRAGFTASRPRVRVNSEPLTYDRGSGQSFFGDLLASRQGDRDAADRLGEHRRQMDSELASDEFALSSADTAGGDFVPPLHLFEEWAGPAHSSRPFTSALNLRPLPDHTDTINIPRIVTGATVASQSGENTTISNTDPVSDTVSTPVRTIAGYVDVSLQSLERSLPGLDEIIFSDLTGAWNDLFEQQVLAGAGTGGTMKGVTKVSGTNTVTYTDADPTVPELYPKIAEAASLIGTGRRRAANVICMHPRRWAWFLAARDTTNRPLVVPASGMNPVGEMVSGATEGFVGSLIGIPVVASSQIPTNLGTGTNQDVIVLARREELLVFDTQPFARVFEGAGSDSLTVRLRLHSYGAFCADRYPLGIAVISGTGLAAPTFV